MRKEIIIGLLLALFIAVALSPFASSSPDGLEKVAEDKGFLHKAEGKELINSPFPDYEVPGLTDKTAAGILAGAIGTIITFAVMLGIGKAVSIRNKDNVMLKE